MFKFKHAEPGEEEQKTESSQEEQKSSGSNDSLKIELTKLKAQFDQFSELRKIINERFTRINEQTGELRGMIMDTNRSMQDIEIKTVKAVDLVEAVQPDKLMVEVRKQDAKIESLKAGIESNDAIMKSIMDQVKDMRHQMTAFRGLEQVLKLNEEVKKELMDIRKVEANVQRHADKVDGVFTESQKRFQDFETIGDKIKELQKQTASVTQIAEQTKVKVSGLAAKKDVEELISKFNNFEKHVGNVINLLTKRANDMAKDIDDRFKKLEENINKNFENHLKRAKLSNKIIEKIEQDAPRIAKELQIAQQLKDVDVKDVGTAEGEDLQESVEETQKEQKGFFSKFFSKKEKKE